MALRLIGISKRYGGQQVLDAVSLHVRTGDCYGFLGHNGAGKTTAMRIALGLARPDVGRVLVEGFDAAAHPLEARARMGALIETPGFHGALSGRTNLVLLARLQGIARRAARVEADRVLEAVGLTHAASKSSGVYSQGMRQRLGIAQALLGRPPIVLLDEPTNGLDPEGIEEIRRLLRRLTTDEGATVLLSSHQLHEIAGVCNRVGILREGRLLVEGETAHLVGSAAARHMIVTGDDARARDVLASVGIAAAPARGGGAGLEADLGARSAGDVARALVGAGIELRALTRRETTLEEIYLEFTRRDGGREGNARTEGGARVDGAAVAAARPAERRASGAPLGRIARYDASRWIRGVAVPVALCAPAISAVLAVAAEAAAAAPDSDRVAGGSLASATHVTAFTGAAAGLKWGVPFLAVSVATLAALSIAGEFGRGTLRNVVLRPTGRARAVLGKTVSSLGAAAAGYAVLLGATFGAAAAWFDFDDVVEILPNGRRFVLEGFAASDLWPELWRAVAHVAAPVAAFAGVGVLVGAVVRSGAAAVIGVFAATAVLVAFSASFPRAGGAWTPAAHVPWGKLTDHSWTQRVWDLSTGASNATVPGGGGPWVAAAWLAVSVGAASAVMRRRAIP